jgi:transcriptional regulator with XRE-family HTH domain
MNTQKIMTEWGELSIVYRKGYYYAIKQMRGQKRQIYLGKTIPSQERLEEIAEELNLPPDKWNDKHSKKPKQVEDSNLTYIINTLNKI